MAPILHCSGAAPTLVRVVVRSTGAPSWARLAAREAGSRRAEGWGTSWEEMSRGSRRPAAAAPRVFLPIAFPNPFRKDKRAIRVLSKTCAQGRDGPRGKKRCSVLLRVTGGFHHPAGTRAGL